MSILLEGAVRIFCDNEAVYKNILDLKHQSFAYHIPRQSVAANIIIVYKEDSEINLADILTKSTLSRDRWIFLRGCIMTNIKVDSIPGS